MEIKLHNIKATYIWKLHLKTLVFKFNKCDIMHWKTTSCNDAIFTPTNTAEGSVIGVLLTLYIDIEDMCACGIKY